MPLDETDLKVLQCLTLHGRMTWSELAGMLGLSAPAAADRVRRLEERGIIQGYTAQIDPKSLGLDLTAFISVTLEHPGNRATFLETVRNLTQVLECHHVTGSDDYLLKVRCRNTADLEQLVSEELKGAVGVLRTRTSIALSTVKETSALPLELNKITHPQSSQE